MCQDPTSDSSRSPLFRFTYLLLQIIWFGVSPLVGWIRQRARTSVVRPLVVEADRGAVAQKGDQAADVAAEGADADARRAHDLVTVIVVINSNSSTNSNININDINTNINHSNSNSNSNTNSHNNSSSNSSRPRRPPGTRASGPCGCRPPSRSTPPVMIITTSASSIISAVFVDICYYSCYDYHYCC